MCIHTWCITATCAHNLPARTHMYVQIHTHVYAHHLVYHSYMCTQSTCTHTYVCSNTHTCVYTPPGVSHLHVHTIYLHAHICMYVCTASPAMPIPSHIPRTRPTCQNQPLFPRSNRLKRVGLHHTNLCAGTGWPTVPRTFCAHVEQRLLMTLCNATCTTQICVPGTGWPTVLHMSCAHAEQRHLKERRESSQSDKRRTGKR